MLLLGHAMQQRVKIEEQVTSHFEPLLEKPTEEIIVVTAIQKFMMIGKA